MRRFYARTRCAGLAALTLLCAPGPWSRAALADETPPTVAPGAELVELYAAKAFFEGPTWDHVGGKLYFTSFAGEGGKDSKILRLDAPGKVSVWLDKTEGVNGTYLGLDGRLLGAQAFGHRVMSYAIGPDGPTDARVLLFDDKLHQPNDVCQAPNGDVYFSDPDFSGKKTGAVYLLKAHGKATKIIDDMPVPNGVQVSRDGKTLYIGDDHLDHWRAYPIRPDGTTGPGKPFFDPDLQGKTNSDGLTLDEKGNLYFSGQCCFEEGKGGVWVVSPQGKSLGRIPTPTFCSNVEIGGPDGKTLYMTCADHLYSLQLTVRSGEIDAKKK